MPLENAENCKEECHADSYHLSRTRARRLRQQDPIPKIWARSFSPDFIIFVPVVQGARFAELRSHSHSSLSSIVLLNLTRTKPPATQSGRSRSELQLLRCKNLEVLKVIRWHCRCFIFQEWRC